jgi:WD40 repeat protein
MTGTILSVWLFPLIATFVAPANTTQRDGTLQVTGPAWAVSFSPDGKLLMAVDGERVIHVWGSDARKEQLKLPGLRHPTALFSRDSKQLIVAHREVRPADLEVSVIAIYDIATGKLESKYQARGWVGSLALSSDGASLVTNGHDKLAPQALSLWSLEKSKELTYQTFAGTEYFSRLVVSPDGKRIAAACGYGRAAVFSLPSLQLDQALRPDMLDKGLQRELSGIVFLVWSPDGTTLIAGDDDGHVIQWNVATGEPRPWVFPKELNLFRGKDGALVPEKPHLLVVADFRELLLLDLVKQTTRVLRHRAHEKDITSISFSPDSKLLATASYDGTIKLWNVAKLLESNPEK